MMVGTYVAGRRVISCEGIPKSRQNRVEMKTRRIAEKEKAIMRSGVAGIFDLPEDLLRVINEFSSIDRLLQANRLFFFKVKRSIYYYQLTKEQSKKYHAYVAFRDAVKRRTKDVSKRLSLNLSGYDVTDVSTLGGVHALNLSGCVKITDISMLGGVHTLDLRGCSQINDVSELKNVVSLDIRHCPKISTDVCQFKNLVR